jgi:hypothetical protein
VEDVDDAESEGVYPDADEAAYDEWIENLHNKGYKHVRKGILLVKEYDSEKSKSAHIGNGHKIDDDTGANDPNGIVQKKSV